jgi:GNAT superfamily N-acetyltransferase
MNANVIRNLGDGLILRRSTAEDAGRLVAFHGDVHSEAGAEGPDEYVAAWVRDLMRGDHPVFDVGGFTIVEDTRSGAIVSSLCLIPQIWSYGGVRFAVGRPELVATHPDYRNRGLVRAQFELIHEWSASRGHKMQAITGIPYFYRQFGYEMGLALGGGCAGYGPQVPKPKEGEEDSFYVRPATEADLPFIARVYEHGNKRYPVACLRDEDLWRYELLGKSERSDQRQTLRLIETAEGEAVGFLAHSTRLRRDRLGIMLYELKAGISWLSVTPSVVRYLWTLGEQWAARDTEQEMQAFFLWLGAEHPAYRVLRNRLSGVRPPYAWYVRVPDLVDFLQHIAPVLGQRLSGSALAGHTGQIRISFYRDGLRLVFENGQLSAIEPWQPTPREGGDAGFPDLTFLQLLFGYRSLEELRYAFADCWAADDGAHPLLAALFPRQSSHVWPVS